MKCNNPNCIECIFTPSVCNKCSDGYLMYHEDCFQLCPDAENTCLGSEICVNESTCQKCPRDMINVGQQCLCKDKTVCGERQYCNGKTCVSCSYNMPNCIECSSFFECEQCKEGYDIVDGKCQQKCGNVNCAENAVCSGDQCVLCEGNFTNNGGQCKCRGPTPDCPEGSFCDWYGCTLCSAVMPNCIACTGEEACTAVLNRCDDYNCMMCADRTSVCQKCNDGYVHSVDACVFDCGASQVCSGVSICNDEQKCIWCPYGMRNQANICTCGDEICTELQHCIPTDRKCYPCSLNMPNCKKCTDLKTCTEFLSPCMVANCEACENGVDKCSKCSSGYVLTDNACLQLCGSFQCHENEICVSEDCKLCLVNEINVAGACSCGLNSHCQEKTFCSTEGKCEACLLHCKTCSDATCYVCETGYLMDNGACKKSNKTVIIAGSVAGGVVILLLIAAALYYFLKYRKQREFSMKQSAQPTTSHVADIQQDQMCI